MDTNMRRKAFEIKAAEAQKLRSKIFSFFSFEVCLFAASAVLFSAHLVIEFSNEKLLNEGIAVEGVITKKIETQKRNNKTIYFLHSLQYRYSYHNNDYMADNDVSDRLWNEVREGDTILLAVDSDNPARSRIKSSEVIIGVSPTLKFLSLNCLAIGIIFLVVSWILKKFYGKKGTAGAPRQNQP